MEKRGEMKKARSWETNGGKIESRVNRTLFRRVALNDWNASRPPRVFSHFGAAACLNLRWPRLRFFSPPGVRSFFFSSSRGVWRKLSRVRLIESDCFFSFTLAPFSTSFSITTIFLYMLIEILKSSLSRWKYHLKIIKEKILTTLGGKYQVIF